MLADEGERYVLTAPLPSLAIPTSLHDLLHGPARPLCRGQGGRADRRRDRPRIPYLRSRQSRRCRQRARPSLAQLTALAELIFRRGHPARRALRLQARPGPRRRVPVPAQGERQQLHGRIAQVLEEQSVNAAGETGPEVLARHLTDAGVVKRAVPYWLSAGELAAGRSANLEAIAHLSKGLDLNRGTTRRGGSPGSGVGPAYGDRRSADGNEGLCGPGR